MLVLSRNPGDSVTFPELDIVVEILKVHGNRVQLGIDASQTIRVLRTELIQLAESTSNAEAGSKESRHQFRNELNSFSLALALAENHLKRGSLEDARASVRSAIDRFMQSENGETKSAIPQCSKAERSSLAGVLKKKVLIVEDNPNEGQLLGEVLIMHGFDVEIVEDGRDAIEWLRSNTPDVILMDMHMKHFDGPTTIQQIRQSEAFATLPIFAVTGATPEEMTCTEQSPIRYSHWFQKPVRPQPLLKALDEVFSQSISC